MCDESGAHGSVLGDVRHSHAKHRLLACLPSPGRRNAMPKPLFRAFLQDTFLFFKYRSHRVTQTKLFP